MEENYIPFGEEWQKHVARLPKRELVAMLTKALREKAILEAAQQQDCPHGNMEPYEFGRYCKDCGMANPVR